METGYAKWKPRLRKRWWKDVTHCSCVTYKEFLNCQPLNIKGAERVVILAHWFEKMEFVFHISNCTVECQDAMEYIDENDDLSCLSKELVGTWGPGLWSPTACSKLKNPITCFKCEIIGTTFSECPGLKNRIVEIKPEMTKLMDGCMLWEEVKPTRTLTTLQMISKLKERYFPSYLVKPKLELS
ncbi:hypothetical protein Tco_0879441 [Tanacetum coccineum]